MKSTRMVCSLILLSSHFLLDAASSSEANQVTHKRYDREFLRRELVALENESLNSIASEQHAKAAIREVKHFEGRLATLDYIDGSGKFVGNCTAQPVVGKEIEDERFEGGSRIVGTYFPKDALFAQYAQKNNATYTQQIAQLTEQADNFFAAVNLSPRDAYYVRAAIEGFKLAELDEDVRTYVHEFRRPEPQTEDEAAARQKEQLLLTRNETLVAKAFSGMQLPKKIRFAGAMRLADVVQAVQDPSPTTGLRSYFGTYEPTVVRNFNALQQQILAETDPEKKTPLIQEWDKQLTAIHAHAVTYLTSLLDVDRETKEARTFTANIRDLQLTLRQINEIKMLQANMQQDISSSVPSSSSSSADRFDS